MRNNLTWALFLILPCVLVTSRPAHLRDEGASVSPPLPYDAHNLPDQEDTSNTPPGQVISVRITSSVAVGRGKNKHNKVDSKHGIISPTHAAPVLETLSTVVTQNHLEAPEMSTTMSPGLAGANIEFIKQLHSKKESRGLQNFERIHQFPSDIGNHYSNETSDSVAESSLKSTVLEVESKTDASEENIENVPLARSVPLIPPSKNYIQGPTRKPLSERGNNPRLTTVSFNIVHDSKKDNYNEPTDTYVSSERSQAVSANFYNEPPHFYNEPAKVYSQPAQVYSEPAKFYSEPAKVYSEPAKIYSEPAKIYSEPAKVYSEPAKFYSQPASLHLPGIPPSYSPWQHQSQSPAVSTTIVSTTPVTTVTIPPMTLTKQRIVEHQPEKNYEVDEKVSVLTDGRSHGVQESTTESCKQENCKVGYVVEGRQYRKYRVEERTSDGFIVGEYGVVRNEDGALRGVRYTADSDASPRLIYDALMKFLQLK